jgi:rubrerythrin
MDLKLFFSTFVLIFLAELGDKTQLAAMARSASGGKVTVFFAASAALVCSTLVAVAFGSALTKFVPEVYIKIISGLLFVLFGGLILYNAFCPKAEAKPIAEEKVGAFSRFVLKTAVSFEQVAATNYATLAQACESPELKQLLLSLAEDESRHLLRLRSAHAEHGDIDIPEFDQKTPPVLTQLAHDLALNSQPILKQAIEHEQAAAAFYDELAKVTRLPALRHIFASLAAEEHGHVRKLQSLAG